MAIDATGKPTTTGMMDSRPKVPKAPNLSNLGKANKKVSPSPQPVTERKADPIQDELANRLKKLMEYHKEYSKLNDLSEIKNKTLKRFFLDLLEPKIKRLEGFFGILIDIP